MTPKFGISVQLSKLEKYTRKIIKNYDEFDSDYESLLKSTIHKKYISEK